MFQEEITLMDYESSMASINHYPYRFFSGTLPLPWLMERYCHPQDAQWSHEQIYQRDELYEYIDEAAMALDASWIDQSGLVSAIRHSCGRTPIDAHLTFYLPDLRRRKLNNVSLVVLETVLDHLELGEHAIYLALTEESRHPALDDDFGYLEHVTNLLIHQLIKKCVCGCKPRVEVELFCMQVPGCEGDEYVYF